MGAALLYASGTPCFVHQETPSPRPPIPKTHLRRLELGCLPFAPPTWDDQCILFLRSALIEQSCLWAEYILSKHLPQG